ncbi:Clavaminate synthase-like protein [Mycena alexandri]|uniref:Clavaminate synthase-like protein n=1 Tax=Mycena alexandri TaxID=1745969 RepID=A0AAD6SH86_9AGAR|nr:Clavaminate synthase-like protein [Mycena alexandri]
MPALSTPYAPRYMAPPTTEENLDYADLAVIDISKAQDAQGRAELTRQVSKAMETHSFSYVVNHGYTTTQVLRSNLPQFCLVTLNFGISTERMFDIADVAFSGVDVDEKRVYTAKMKEEGTYQGYKPTKYWHIDNGVRDQVEQYNINRDVTKRPHPEALRPFLGEIEAVARHTHFNILHPVLRLLALGLELPEDALVNLHGFSSVGETHDIGTITVLYSQPVSALQILRRDGKWKWIKHIENAAVVNVGDALEFISGGYYRGTIHRVVQPPAGQQNYPRLGLFYFTMTDDNVKLVPLTESPVLQRVGIVRRYDDADAPTMEAWRRSRTSAYGQSELKAASGSEGKVEEEVVGGVLVKHYN